MRADPESRVYAGAGTSYFQQHRGIHRLDLKRSTLFYTVVSTLSCVSILLAGERHLAIAWGHAFAAIHRGLDLAGTVVMSKHSMSVYTLFVPYMDLPVAAPSTFILVASVVIVALMFVLSFVIAAHRVPLRYLLRLIAIVHSAATGYFYLFPDFFPYTLADYMRGMMTASYCVILIVPILLGFTYYLIDVSWIKKWSATLLIIAYLAILAPLKYALQAVLLHHGSMLFLPLLYLVGGIPLDVFVFIALYAWAMSWSGQASSTAMNPITLPSPGHVLRGTSARSSRRPETARLNPDRPVRDGRPYPVKPVWPAPRTRS